MAGRQIVVPEISDYEVRRELLRNNSQRALINLDQLGSKLIYLPITTPDTRKAAALWAWARQNGVPTAGDSALDGDVIIAAQAQSLNQPVVVATSNPMHLSRYVSAEEWSKITP
jgi:predicted nucleic acid-binding protein